MTYVIAAPCIDFKDKSCIEDQLGPPSGAAKIGPRTRDADYIANYVLDR
jgi:hypothetical protein